MPLNKANEIQLQIVFQGGGAKLCALMAVCEVLKEYEGERRVKEELPRIKVTRVGGTSAGAIAAVMFASETPVTPLTDRALNSMPRRLWLAWRLGLPSDAHSMASEGRDFLEFTANNIQIGRSAH